MIRDLSATVTPLWDFCQDTTLIQKAIYVLLLGFVALGLVRVKAMAVGIGVVLIPR
jgi:hypothetical protein